MINYFVKYNDKLMFALLEHLQIVLISLVISLILASLLTLVCIYFSTIQEIMLNLTAVIYSIPSLAMFAIMIPLTGLGKTTAILVLVIYNQYLLLRNFLTGLNEVDKAIIEAANGMGMRKIETLKIIQIPLAKKSIFAGIRLALVSTIGIATIAASINAGGLGAILFDGLRTMNTYKIIWGSLLAAGLAIVADFGIGRVEKSMDHSSKGSI